MKSTLGIGLGALGKKVGTATLVGFLGAALASGCSGKSSDDDDSGGESSAGRNAPAGSSGNAGRGGSGGSAGSDCEPRPCTASVCGEMRDDGCGNLVECSCPDGCVPATCEGAGAECGDLDDGCGETLDCGDCEGEETCGGSGVPNVCGCEPATCESEGRQCGELSDGCGGTLECGECKSGCSCNDDGICLDDGGSVESPRRYGQKAESSGFTGTLDQYDELYVEPCFSSEDCVAPCLERDGSAAMCRAMTCVEGGDGDHCLPPTIWLRLEALAAEGTDPISDCAELVVWPDPYRDFLRVSDFKFEIPEAAEIEGITVTVRHAGGSPNEVVDDGVHLIKGGAMGSADRSSPTPWAGPDLANVDYGGPTDLWNETWTPADINAPDFGVALSAAYTLGAGNNRAYVDIVYVTVHYRAACE